MTWSSFHHGGDPVRGNIAEFEAAVRGWADARQKGHALRSEFRSIVAGGSHLGLEGHSATAFKSVVVDTQRVLDDVPEVFGSLELVLNEHLSRLRELRRQADAALARAKVARAQREAAAQQQAGSSTRIATLQRQIQELRALPPEQVGGQLVGVERQLEAETRTRNSRSAEMGRLQQRIETELGNWQEYRDAEEVLNARTAGKLGRVDLRSLRDPSWLEQQVTNVSTFFKELGSEIIKLGKAALSGDLEAAMFHLHKVLDKVTKILHLVIIVLKVVVVVAALLGTVVSFGALLPILAAVVLVLAAVKLNTSVALVAMDATHPDTGEKMGLVDIGFDALDVAFAASQFKNIQNFAGNNVGRQFLKEQTGLSFKHGNEISIKETVWSTGKLFIKRVGKDPGVRDGGRRLGPDGGIWAGTSAQRATCLRINEGIRDIKSGNRGLSAPIQTTLIGAQ